MMASAVLLFSDRRCVTLSRAKNVNGAVFQELDGTLDQRDRDGVGRVGSVTNITSTYPRKLAGSLARTGIDRQPVADLFAKMVEIHEHTEIFFHSGRGNRGAVAASPSDHHALEAQKCGRIKIGKPTEAFCVHPLQQTTQVHKHAGYCARAMSVA